MKKLAVRRWMLVSLIGVSIKLAAQDAAFPGIAKEIKSPNGRFSIRNFDRVDPSPNHWLALIDTAIKSRQIIHYDRHVSVLWAPSSDYVVVNDFEGSDSTRPYLYVLPWRDGRLDLLMELKRFLSQQHQAGLISKNGHFYLEVKKWTDSKALLCQLRVYGWNNPVGLVKDYKYKIGIGFQEEREPVQPSDNK